MPMETRRNRRGIDEHYVSGRHLNLNDLKQEARHLENDYLIKKNIPTSPKPEFHVTRLKHDTNRQGLRGIRKDEGFRVPHEGSDDPHNGILLWWSLAVGPEEVQSAETRLLFSDPTEDQAAMQPSFLYKFTTSPAFSEKSRLGSYRFTFPLEEVLEAYSQQFCSGDQPVMRVYETVLYKQEVVHSVLVHSKANEDLFSKYPLLTDDPNAVCVYKDGRFIWRPYAMSKEHRYELVERPKSNQMDTHRVTERDKEFYVWDNVAIVLHVDEQLLKFDADRLRKNLKFCKEGAASIGSFDFFEDAKNEVKDLWPLEKECSLEQRFTVTDLRLVLVGRTGSGKSSTGNIILGSDAFSAGNIQCCLQKAKVFNWEVTIIDTPCLSETPEVKTEISKCIDMLAKGPHGFLLVIKMGTLISEEKDAVRQMKEIFGEDVWRHTFIVLTCDNQSETDVQILNRTKTELQEILPWSMKDRYYVLNNNRKTSNNKQVWDLLDEVTKEVVGRREKVYSFEDRVIWVPDLRLVLVGRTGSGKSSSGNIILGRDAFSAGSAQCCMQTKKVPRWEVTIVNTPGLSETPEVKTEIRSCVDMLAPGPHAFLLVIKMGALIDEEAVRQMEEIFGNNVWWHTLVVLTHDNQPKSNVELQEVQSKLKKILPQIMENRYYVLNINPKSSNFPQINLLKTVEKMVVGNREKFYSVQNISRKRKITDVDGASTA